MNALTRWWRKLRPRRYRVVRVHELFYVEQSPTLDDRLLNPTQWLRLTKDGTFDSWYKGHYSVVSFSTMEQAQEAMFRAAGRESQKEPVVLMEVDAP